MTVSNEQFQALINRSQRREQRARKVAFALAAVPALVGLAFLAFSLWRTYGVQQELVQTQDQLETSEIVLQETINRYQSADTLLNQSAQAREAAEMARDTALRERDTALAERDAALKEREAAAAQLDETQAQLALANTRLQESEASLTVTASQLKELEGQVRRASQLAVEMSYPEWRAWRDRSSALFGRLYANFPDQQAMLERLLGTLDKQYADLPPFALNGSSPETGFNSPGFALHVLQSIGRVPAGDAPAPTTAGLRDHLQASGLLARRERVPQPGDLVFYDDGLVMFYFPDSQRQRPFVIGMTAAGVKTVEAGFGQITDVIAVLP